MPPKIAKNMHLDDLSNFHEKLDVKKSTPKTARYQR